MDIASFLVEWAEHYLRSRDAHAKEIVSIDPIEHGLLIKRKDRDEKVFSCVHLEEITPESGATIITLNNRKNIDHLYHYWERYASCSRLKVFFINPFSLLEKRWIINPSVHDKICDKASLKVGLVSMFQSVDPITEEIFEKKLLKEAPAAGQ